MKKELNKWLCVLACASYAAAVFMIVDGGYWQAILFLGAGTCLYSVAAKGKKDSDTCDGKM